MKDLNDENKQLYILTKKKIIPELVCNSMMGTLLFLIYRKKYCVNMEQSFKEKLKLEERQN